MTLRSRSSIYLALCLASAFAVAACAVDVDQPDDELTTAESSTRGSGAPVKLTDRNGRPITYESRNTQEKQTIDHGVDSFVDGAPVKLTDRNGRPITYESRNTQEKQTIDHGVDSFVDRNGGREPLGCMLETPFSISCWGFGFMCAAWIDEDGAGSQCWRCEVADCE